MKNLRSDIEHFKRLCGHAAKVSTFQFVLACVNPRMLPVVLIRLAESFYTQRLGVLAKLCSMLNVFIFGIEVSPRVKIEGGLFLPHTVGTVIGAASIGRNCTIMQGVTLGALESDLGFTRATRPVIGNDVVIGSGAKVLGGITVGDHAKIGANAVVLCDVPAYAVAVGVPARILAKHPDCQTHAD
ncbi:MAG: serine O-acetyltransferase EpsC [Polaromonas sp.]